MAAPIAASAAREARAAATMVDRSLDASGGPSRYDLVVRGGRVVTRDGTMGRDIGVRDGKIAAVAPHGSLTTERVTVDATDCLVLPGIVDTHFHCRAPERPDREDFDSGTAAAAAGGVTTVFEMPITYPACNTPEVLADRMRLAAETARIDVGLYAAPGDLERPRLREMAALGAVAFKLLLHGPPSGREPAFEGLCITDDGAIYRALEAVRDTGLVCAIHAESQSLIDVLEARERALGHHDAFAHARSRPCVAEALAVARVGAINEDVGADVHIVHVSSRRATEYIRWFQSRGQPMSAETTPAYLLLDQRALDRFGAFLKVNPPLRTSEDQKVLWSGLVDGTLTLVVSDHSPFLPSEKGLGPEGIWGVGPGIPGVEATGRLLWHEALEGRITFEQVAAWCSENPAARFGIGTSKGSLREGADADFVVFDPAGSFTFDADTVHSRSGGSLRHLFGHTVRGDIRSVWSRGRKVMENGTIVASPGSGAIVRPAAAASPAAAGAKEG